MKNVNAAFVRSDLGLTGKRGRISKSDAERFNAAHKGKMQFVAQSAEEKRHIQVPGVVSVDKAGRKTTKTVRILASEARTLVGVPLNQRGRISYGTVALALSAQNADAVADKFTA